MYCINGKQIEFVEQAEHVGVIRSTEGNLPNLLQRISSFKRSLGSMISCGLSKGRRSNPAASLRILTIYSTPVLMSGLASLVLSDSEVSAIDQQYKRTLQNLMKLKVNSPSPLVHFVAGSLPATAILHMKQISLFGMVCRLPGDPLNQQAWQVLLTSPSSSKSWFMQLRNLLLQYQLPHPLKLLDSPPSKEAFKKLVKAKVLDYWETKFRAEASFLPSLVYFHPQYLSLKTTHRLWTAAGPKSYEVAKARIQLLFLSSQYPCAKFVRHWTPDNPKGLCSFLTCKQSQVVESPEHVLLNCPAYTSTRDNMISLCLKTKQPKIHSLVTSLLLSNAQQSLMQFLLDPSSFPEVIKCAQNFGEHIYNDVFYLGRTWCFALHRERMKRIGRWNFR